MKTLNTTAASSASALKHVCGMSRMVARLLVTFSVLCHLLNMRAELCYLLDIHADGIDVQMVSRGPDQGEQRQDQQIPQARFAHGAVRVPSTALDHGKVGNPTHLQCFAVTSVCSQCLHQV